MLGSRSGEGLGMVGVWSGGSRGGRGQGVVGV